MYQKEWGKRAEKVLKMEEVEKITRLEVKKKEGKKKN